MKSIRVRNLRSLKDTEEIAIKKINLLVGSNSSGKSTFLRTFPLLKQSFNKKINGPILWCGDDDDYVDFGSFEEAVNYGTKDKCIKLAFECNVILESISYRYRIKSENRKLENIKVEFSIKSNKESVYDFISQIQLSFRDNIVLVNFSEKNEIENVVVNNKEIPLNLVSNEYYRPFYYEQPLFEISLIPIRWFAEEKIRSLFGLVDYKESVPRELEDLILYLYDKNIELSSIKKTKKEIDKVYKENKEEIEQWMMLYILPDYFNIVASYLRAYFRKVYYMAPVRATAERYYKLRNFAVDEVDCRGKNLAVFLNSLTSSSFAQFQSWTRENLGFEVIKSPSEGHVSLKIKRRNQKKAVNLSDTGFGYSQILPIVTQLWYIAKQAEEEEAMPFRREDYDIPTTIVIEQPELHLHPGFQAKLIDIIAKVAQQGKVNFVIETHSETMINRIGHIISNEGLNNSDVGITIFEKEMGDDNTLIRQGGYDEEGYLENWPIGFFEPEEE